MGVLAAAVHQILKEDALVLRRDDCFTGVVRDLERAAGLALLFGREKRERAPAAGLVIQPCGCRCSNPVVGATRKLQSRDLADDRVAGHSKDVGNLPSRIASNPVRANNLDLFWRPRHASGSLGGDGLTDATGRKITRM